MATTVDLNNITEYSEKPEELQRKIYEVAQSIKESKHCIIFTGAGISTSANIPDFRGPNGVWTCQAKGTASPDCIPLVQAIPTECHNFLLQNIQDGTFKYIVSQNIDGLHRRSGIARDKLSELHGNTFLEVCWNCGADSEHPTEVHGGLNRPKTCKECHPKVPHFCHCSGNKCTKCGAMMKDSIIHFGENLPEEALSRGYEHAKKADLCIVFGSSLTVSPANDIPARVAKKKGGKLIVINLQKTDLDKYCSTRIFAKTDAVCMMLRQAMSELSGSSTATTTTSAAALVQPSTTTHRAAAASQQEVTTTIPAAASHSGSYCHIGNTVKKHGDAYAWTMYCQGNGTLNVKEVTYHLHPTFTPSQVTVTSTEANPNCELVRQGWGTFDVACDITFTNASVSPVRRVHTLSFEQDRTETSYSSVELLGR